MRTFGFFESHVCHVDDAIVVIVVVDVVVVVASAAVLLLLLSLSTLPKRSHCRYRLLVCWCYYCRCCCCWFHCRWHCLGVGCSSCYICDPYWSFFPVIVVAVNFVVGFHYIL